MTHPREAVGRSDVSLNLRIASARTAALGVDEHICELQLILQSFVELKVRSVGPC